MTNELKVEGPLLWRQVLIAAITLTAVALAILLNQRTYRETREMATEHFNEQQLILAREAAAAIETFVINIKDDLLALSRLPSVQRMEPGILDDMEILCMGFPPATSSRRLDRNGILRFIYPSEGWRNELIGRDYSKKTYFIQAREQGETVSTRLTTDEIGEIRIRVAHPIFIEDEKGAREFDGVVIVTFNPTMLNKLYISPIVSGNTGYAWLLDQDGTFLAHYEEEFIGRSASEVRRERNPEISYEAIDQIQEKMIVGEEGVSCYVSGWHRGQIGEIEKLLAYTPIQVNGYT